MQIDKQWPVNIFFIPRLSPSLICEIEPSVKIYLYLVVCLIVKRLKRMNGLINKIKNPRKQFTRVYFGNQ